MAAEVTVRLPHQLRERARGRSSLTVQASTVREALQALDKECPGMTFSICHENGELRPFVNVFVGPEDVKYLQGMNTPVDGTQVIHIIHSVAGGAQPP
jgi:molybdopterin synthase sulfur carrier subunit